jgi:hypothetical protein
MVKPGNSDSALLQLVRAIVAGDATAVSRLLAASPGLARACFVEGATRQSPKPHFIDEIKCYVYAGDTALHMAAAAYQAGMVQQLIALGADVKARNRHGGEPLHAAAVGGPGSRTWNPTAQAATIACLIAAGADPDAINKNGVTPLHRAVRTRCAAAVKALLEGGADARRKNNSGSTPELLAVHNTGRGGTGSPEAKAQQREILLLLQQHGATGS